MTTEAHRLHAHLIGQQGSRALLNTPALVLDLDRLERNIAAMAAFAKSKNIKLRPHAKTHKSVEIAKKQIAAGAIGVCCAKLGEAEALSAGGIKDILITTAVVAPPGIERLLELAQTTPGLMTCVDHKTNVENLARAAAEARQVLTVVMDLDPGIHRTGVANPEEALAMAKQIASKPSLKFAGVQFYCGRQQHIDDYAERRKIIEERTEYLRGIVDSLTAAGLKPGIITGGGSGTHSIDADLGLFTDLQVGSYVFMDAQYGTVDFRGDGKVPFETALQVDARVVSAGTPGLATIDSGLKAFSAEAGPAKLIDGVPEGTTFRFAGDEHAILTLPAGSADLIPGHQVTLQPPHCDPTVNLYDAYHVVRGRTIVDIWTVDGRGRSR